MGCWGDYHCQEAPKAKEVLINGCASCGQRLRWVCATWQLWAGGGCKSTGTHGAASAFWISPAFLLFSCCHTPGWKTAFFTPEKGVHHQSKMGPGSARDLNSFRQVELLLSASQSLCLFSPSHLLIVKPLRWDITSGVWKCSAQQASDFDQGFWGSDF